MQTSIIWVACATVKGISPFTETIKVTANDISANVSIRFIPPTSTRERCRQYGLYVGIPFGDFVESSGPQSITHTYTASEFLYPENIKSYSVQFACGNGTCNFKINDKTVYSGTFCPLCPERSPSYEVTMPVTISSNSSLGVGLRQSAFRICALY